MSPPYEVAFLNVADPLGRVHPEGVAARAHLDYLASVSILATDARRDLEAIEYPLSELEALSDTLENIAGDYQRAVNIVNAALIRAEEHYAAKLRK